VTRPNVLVIDDLDSGELARLFCVYGLELVRHPEGCPIEGSYWGAPEAGLVGKCVHVRGDTPVHSALHEAAHLICMTPARRSRLHTDAGGDDLEESAVCYLQVMLAGELPSVGVQRLQQDMDSWGYSFRLGSTRAWFERDAADARDWLLEKGLLDASGMPVFRLRDGGE
jgi:hypothetical protein